MASGQTANYQLNQWEAEDKVLRTEFNADNAKLDAALAELAADYRETEASREGRGLFLPAFRVDEEYAVSLDQHITLHKLVKREPPYGELVPWYYQYGQRYLGDAWWFSPEEILADFRSLSTVAFLKKYKGF